MALTGMLSYGNKLLSVHMKLRLLPETKQHPPQHARLSPTCQGPVPSSEVRRQGLSKNISCLFLGFNAIEPHMFGTHLLFQTRQVNTMRARQVLEFLGISLLDHQDGGLIVLSDLEVAWSAES